ncbi:MAG TPA: hypothetical protein DCZ95_18495 [Verrucomicrobia bacterium]|nr:MAG: hypothetical protein A2X46_16640 [Lentisphaerae bacterium GWF2_57_35]HBA86079.1 hypothetical protein [Verrucomicrobiota bacterium]
MSLIAIKDALLFFVSQWMGTTLPRLMAAFAGLLMLVLCLWARWEKRIRFVPAVVGVLIGAALVGMAMDTRVLHWLAGLSEYNRLRLTIGLLSVLVLGITFEAIRRSHLMERYALLWMGAGVVTLLSAIFPRTLDLVGLIFGADYNTSVLAVLFIFLVLVIFHFSLALSRGDHRESRLTQYCALLEARLEKLEKRLEEPAEEKLAQECSRPNEAVEMPGSTFKARKSRSVSGSKACAWVVIGISALAALIVGGLTPQPMIGDEVTHYHMLTQQAQDLTTPTFLAEIPVGWSDKPEVRGYPHVSGWHYVGAVVYRLTGHSFQGVQFWHVLFWVQLLWVAFLMARRRGGAGTQAPVLYLLLLASMPAAIIFSVAFYQDIPVTAQVLTAFYLLTIGRRWWGLVFLLWAMALKETAFLFLPVFFLYWGVSAWKQRNEGDSSPAGRVRTALSLVLAVLVVSFYSAGWNEALRLHAQAGLYPVQTISNTIGSWKNWLVRSFGKKEVVVESKQISSPAAEVSAPPPLIVTTYGAEIKANHPGDLRLPINFLIYGGALIWLVALGGLGLRLCAAVRGSRPASTPSTGWLWAIGLSYVIPAAYILRTAPDARFFLPAIPFLLLPFVEWAVRTPRAKLVLAVVATLAVLQAGPVYLKVYRLREVSSDTWEAIRFLEKNSPRPAKLFMYPEGNYRFFPAPYDWYMGYTLRDFWRAENDVRLEMLRRNGIGALAIKKHLISPVDKEITNYGVYPDYFVDQIRNDSRFERLFENRAMLIYRVPEVGSYRTTGH